MEAQGYDWWRNPKATIHRIALITCFRGKVSAGRVTLYNREGLFLCGVGGGRQTPRDCISSEETVNGSAWAGLLLLGREGSSGGGGVKCVLGVCLKEVDMNVDL